MEPEQQFYFPRTPVAVISAGDSGEAQLTRALLESLGASVRLYQPIPSDFLLLLRQGFRLPDYILLCGHGTEDGLFFGEYGADIDTGSLRNGCLSAAAMAAHIDLPKKIVINTACLGGSKEFAAAFIEGGASAYVGCPDYPDGAATHLLMHHLFFRVLYEKKPLKSSLDETNPLVDADSRFTYYPGVQP